MISFSEFLFESENTQAADLFTNLARVYSPTANFYTDNLQFSINQERRDWTNPRKNVKIGQSITNKAFYKLDFTLDGKKYLIEINFNFRFKGQKEKDLPDPTEDAGDLNVVLEEIKIQNIYVKSSLLNLNGNFNKAARDNCRNFLEKVLKNEYDSLGSEIYSLQEK